MVSNPGYHGYENDLNTSWSWYQANNINEQC